MGKGLRQQGRLLLLLFYYYYLFIYLFIIIFFYFFFFSNKPIEQDLLSVLVSLICAAYNQSNYLENAQVLALHEIIRL